MLVALAAMVALAGCSDDVFREPQLGNGDGPAGNIFIRFQMNLNGNGVPGMEPASSRAEAVLPETPGTDMENAINSIALLVYGVDDDGIETEMTNCFYLEREQIDLLTTDAGVIVPMLARVGQKMHIYAVVNPTATMRRMFFGSDQFTDGFIIATDYGQYWDVINEFVPGSDGHQTTLESIKTGGIPMTGVFKMDEPTDITVTDENLITVTEENISRDNPLTVSAYVSRIVAKMHVLAASETADGSTVEYVHADAAPSEKIGWIRLSDVRYIPNGMNKSTYIFPHEHKTQAGKLADNNMDLMQYVVDGRFDSFSYGNNFIFYDGMALHKATIASGDRFARAEALDQARLEDTAGGTNTPNRYTRGMYCLENYFDVPIDAADASFLANYESVLPVVTHISIAAKLTPQNIVVLKDYADKMDVFVVEFENNPDDFLRKYGLTPTDFTKADVTRWTEIRGRYFDSTLPEVYRGEYRIIRTLNEADAIDILNWSLMANELWSNKESDFTIGKYPDATFYVYDTNYDPEGTTDAMWTQRFLYLTAGAAIHTSDANMRIKTYSVPHVGGWGYYYTYLDQLNQTPDGGITPYTSSQVTRNTYYLVYVANFGVPGGSITRPEYIRVNTETVGWTYEGKGDINLH